MGSFYDEVPGYREAVAQETLDRDTAFLSLEESIAGFPAVPLTLELLLKLKSVGSPLVCGGSITIQDLSRFLWLVNPRYTPRNGYRKWRFMRRCRSILKASVSLSGLTRLIAVKESISIYLFEAFADMPEGSGVESPSYYSMACAVCAFMGREYGWSERDVLTMPLKRIAQYAREIRQHHGETMPFNRSGKLVSDWLAHKPRG